MLTTIPGGCASATPSPRCLHVPGLGTRISAVGADRLLVFAAPAPAPVAVLLARDPVTGALAAVGGPAGCFGQAPACTALGGPPLGVATTNDGRFIHLLTSNTVAGFAREPAGSLRRLPAPDLPRGARRAVFPFSGAVALSLDGRDLYAGSCAAEGGGADTITHFRRDTSTGGLTRPGPPEGCWGASLDPPRREGCVPGGSPTAEIALPPDGRNAYTIPKERGSLRAYRREPGPRPSLVLRRPRGSCIRSARVTIRVRLRGLPGGSVRWRIIALARGVIRSGRGRTIPVGLPRPGTRLVVAEASDGLARIEDSLRVRRCR